MGAKIVGTGYDMVPDRDESIITIPSCDYIECSILPDKYALSQNIYNVIIYKGCSSYAYCYNNEADSTGYTEMRLNNNGTKLTIDAGPWSPWFNWIAYKYN